MEQWNEVALQLFFKYLEEMDRYKPMNEDVQELLWLNAGKTAVLFELLEKFGHRPVI